MAERSPEQQIREALLHFDVPYNRSLVREALAALDRLVAEREEALKRGAALRDALNLVYQSSSVVLPEDLDVVVGRALAAAAGRTPGEETWDCGCPFDGPHDENCALAEAGRAE